MKVSVIEVIINFVFKEKEWIVYEVLIWKFKQVVYQMELFLRDEN